MGYKRWNDDSWGFEDCEPETPRGCGFRKIHALYMVSDAIAVACDRTVVLEACPVCGAGVHQSRGWTWIQPFELFNGNHSDRPPGMGPDGFPEQPDTPNGPRSAAGCTCSRSCAICYPPEGRAGLLWVGRKFYNPQSFLREARTLGVSRRIAAVPRDFEIGKTVVYLAHPDAIPPGDERLGFSGSEKPKPGILACFRPRLEQLFPESEKESLEVKRAVQRSIVPILYPTTPNTRDMPAPRTRKRPSGRP